MPTIHAEIWISMADLAHRHGDIGHSVRNSELSARVLELFDDDRKGVGIHISQHVVAQASLNTGYNKCYLSSEGRGKRRLYLPGDEIHESRRLNPQTIPTPEELPQQYRYLLDWYEDTIRQDSDESEQAPSNADRLQVGGTEEEQLSVKEGLLQVLDYLEKLDQNARRKRIFKIEDHKSFKIYQQEIPALGGDVVLDLVEQDGQTWMLVRRIHPVKPPQPLEILHDWIVVRDNPTKEPFCRESITVRYGDLDGEDRLVLFDEPHQEDDLVEVHLEDFSDVKEAFDKYLQNDWQAWARSETPRRKTIKVYSGLFNLLQAMESEGAESSIELVWGSGIALWEHEDETIRYPIVTQGVEIDLDSDTMSIRIVPREQDPSVELSPYYTLENPGASSIDDYAKRIFAEAEKTFSPFDKSTYEPILQYATAHLDDSGKYEEDLTGNPDDLRLSPITSDLRIIDSWVLFARDRSNSFLVQDINRLKAEVAGSIGFSGAVRSIIEGPTDSVSSARPPVRFRGVSTPGHGNGGTGDKPRNLFFPKAYNQEQVTVLEKLEQADGVVVEGPPGTGKTHTIANIICHFMAEGKRVLVTSKGEPALSVLRDHIPDSVRPLTISLLTSEREGLKQLEFAVRKIAEEIGNLQPKRVKSQIAETEHRIDVLHQRIAGVDHDISAWARKHLSNVSFIESGKRPDELAQWVVDTQEAFSWFPDKLGSAEKFSPKFSNDDIIELREARRRLGPDLCYFGCDVPDQAGCASPELMMRIHSDLLQLEEITEKARDKDLPRLLDNTTEILVKAEKLLSKADELKGLLETTSGGCFERIRQRYRDSMQSQQSDAVLSILDSICQEIKELEKQRSGFIGRAIEVPDGAESDEDLIEAIEKASAGKRPFSLLSFQKDIKRAFATVRIDGAAPKDELQWKTVVDYSGFLERTAEIKLRWNALESEIGTPTVTSRRMDAAKELEDLSKHVHNARVVGRVYDRHFGKRVCEVFPIGFDVGSITTSGDELSRLCDVIRHYLHQERLQAARNELQSQKDRLEGKSGPVVERLLAFFSNTIGNDSLEFGRVQDEYRKLMRELDRVATLATDIRVIEQVTSLIAESGAPLWTHQLRESPADPDHDGLIPSNLFECWNWARASGFIEEIDSREELKRLSKDRLEAEHDLVRSNERLVELLTWLRLHENTTGDIKAALQDYATALLRIGRGTGIRAKRFRRDARRAMTKANQAVPCWIMPHWRVSESLPPALGSFDVVIVDEASQSDIWALPSLLRGKKILVVGDDKQVSPSDVGIKEKDIIQLKEQFLKDLPFGHLLLPGSSIYDLAIVTFASDRVGLREHFRCVEPIIEFSKHWFYNDELRPLRLPKHSERLDPPLVDVFVKGGYRDERSKVNRPEAKAIVDEIKEIVNNPRLSGRTIGVVSLLGYDQARLIQEMLTMEIGEEKILAHKIRCGDAMTFQGKEADIIMLSMVAESGGLRALSGKTYEQRFNVAASRARDRMYLFRSFTREELSEKDLRSKLVNHFFHPFQLDTEKVEKLRELCESGFERSVYDALVAKGYSVRPQVRVGDYRIDLVVQGEEDRRLAIELDGEQHLNTWQEDIARQRVLERMGWRFWRCWRANYIVDPNACLGDLFDTLSERSIHPGFSEETDFSKFTEHRIVEPEKDVPDQDTTDSIAGEAERTEREEDNSTDQPAETADQGVHIPQAQVEGNENEAYDELIPVARNKASGKYFTYLESYGDGLDVVINPHGKSIPFDTRLFEEPEEEPLESLIARNLINDTQMSEYRKHKQLERIRHDEQDPSRISKKMVSGDRDFSFDFKINKSFLESGYLTIPQKFNGLLAGATELHDSCDISLTSINGRQLNSYLYHGQSGYGQYYQIRIKDNPNFIHEGGLDNVKIGEFIEVVFGGNIRSPEFSLRLKLSALRSWRE